MDFRLVGGGGFKEAPMDGRVEIAYFTVPEFEGRGFASRTARTRRDRTIDHPEDGKVWEWLA